MDFTLNDDQIMIRDAAESFLADVADSTAVRKAVAAVSGYDESVWQRIGAELGWCGIPIPEEHGGLGLGAVELTLVQEQIGRRLLPSPFFATAGLAATLLQEAGSEAAQAEYLPRIAAGALRASAALPTATGWHAAARGLRATQENDGWRLRGTVERLPDAQDAELLLIFAETDHGLALFALPAQTLGLQLATADGWDATRRFSSATLDLALPATARIDDPIRAAEGLVRSFALAQLYVAAEQLGAAQQCLDLTVAYAGTRKQFGRVIASFQAVKHRCAEMMVKIEALRSAVYGAAAQAGGGADVATLAQECAGAKALASDALFYCAQEAIQLHGGVGFTWEYDPQLYFKRAQASSHWLGSAHALRAELADALLA